MITLDEIRAGYPPALHDRTSFLLREYLQYRILQLIFRTEYARHLVFLGGTCLRLVHGNQRFSEDLDFDNRGLDQEAFKSLGESVKQGLEREGYSVEIEIRSRTAYRCKVRFPGLLFQHGLSGHVDQNILIQFDTEPQQFHYTPDLPRLDKFDVSFSLPCCSPGILLAQKCHAILGRPRNKGRDFYDVVFLLGRLTEPDMRYVQERINVNTLPELCDRLLAHCSTLDMEEQAEDVRPFLFDATMAERVVHFPQLIEQHWSQR